MSSDETPKVLGLGYTPQRVLLTPIDPNRPLDFAQVGIPRRLVSEVSHNGLLPGISNFEDKQL